MEPGCHSRCKQIDLCVTNIPNAQLGQKTSRGSRCHVPTENSYMLRKKNKSTSIAGSGRGGGGGGGQGEGKSRSESTKHMPRCLWSFAHVVQ